MPYREQPSGFTEEREYERGKKLAQIYTMAKTVKEQERAGARGVVGLMTGLHLSTYDHLEFPSLEIGPQSKINLIVVPGGGMTTDLSDAVQGIPRITLGKDKKLGPWNQ
jgi:hypothetical protein